MTTLVKITIAIVLALFCSSCVFNFDPGKKGNGVVTTESRPISGEFTEISASEGLMVYVTQADEFEIKVEADENLIELIGTDIKNGKLSVHAIKNIGSGTKNVYVSLPEVTALKGSSGAHLKTQNTVKADDLEIDGSSGAIVKVELEADDVEIDGSSGANLTIVGKTDEADIDVSQGSSINAKDFEITLCIAEASSGGNLSVNVSESLNANASSGGNISYYGDASVQSKKNISGSIVHRD